MENFDRIQRYLSHDMAQEERQQFEEEVRQNESLAEELEIQRFEFETIEQIEEDALREKLQQLSTTKISRSSNVRQLQPSSRNRNTWLIGIAASIALIAGFFFFQNGDDQYSTLTASAYDKVRIDYSRGAMTRGDHMEAIFPSTYTDILRVRNADQAKEAISFFSNYSSDDESIETKALLNLGHAYMLQGDFSQAIASFASVRQSSKASRELIEEASFFEALAHLQLGNKTQAISLLDSLVKDGRHFDAMAKSTLQEIESM
jgi:TolA-binding protein